MVIKNKISFRRQIKKYLLWLVGHISYDCLHIFFRSLVTTNDHLLKELNDTKQRHNNEVQQLNWSYNQLKKSMNMLSTRNESSYLPSVSRDHGHNPGLSRSDQVLGCATLYDGRET